MDTDDPGEQRGPDQAAASGPGPLVQGGEGSDDGVMAGDEVGDGDADALRVVRPAAGQRHQAGLALGDLVVAGATALGPVLAEAADLDDDQARVDLVQPLDGEAEPVEHAWTEVLDEDIAVTHQPGEDVLTIRRLEVEGDRLLVAVGAEVVRRDRLVVRADEGRTVAAVSSPPPGLSTLMTRAPRSPSIMAACGPASARERSTTTMPSSGPLTVAPPDDGVRDAR